MATGSVFHRVLWDDAQYRPETTTIKLAADSKIKKVIICSGKVYYDLYEDREKRGITDTYLLRLEQFYPYPDDAMQVELKRFKNADIIWCQEEPKNMGAWSFINPYIEETLIAIKAKQTRPPNVGESVSEVTIAQWFKQVGEAVKKDEPLVELETDKAAQELVAPADGVLEEIFVAEGDVAEIGKLIAKLGAGSGASAKTASTSPAKATKETPPASSAKASGKAMNIDVPNVGESVSEVTIASWMKQPGEAVSKDEPIVELETDKAAQELVAPQDGVMGEHLVAEGDIAAVGQTICTLIAGASNGAAPAPAAKPAAAAPAATDGSAKVMPSAQRRRQCSPLITKPI